MEIYEALKKSLDTYDLYKKSKDKEKIHIEKELRGILLLLRESLDDIYLGYKTPEENKIIKKMKKK